MTWDLPRDTQRRVQDALDEDIGRGDLTTLACVPIDRWARGVFVAREPLVCCGLPVAASVFFTLNPTVRWSALCQEGQRVPASTVIARVEGPARAVLTGERVALNFVQRLSGVATRARAFADAVAGSGARVVDTRKTTPGLRSLEKYAVRCGGCHNHRHGLDDGILIKDNHLIAAGGVAAAIRAAQAQAHHLVRIEVEVDSAEQAEDAIAAGAQALLLDNMAPDLLHALVPRLRALRRDLLLEASGSITLENARAYAETGVDLLSSGSIIHGARWVDIALDFLTTEGDP